MRRGVPCPWKPRFHHVGISSRPSKYLEQCRGESEMGSVLVSVLVTKRCLEADETQLVFLWRFEHPSFDCYLGAPLFVWHVCSKSVSFFPGTLYIDARRSSLHRTWGSTGKEVEKSTFWIEVPRIIKNFKLSIIICLLLIAMMVVFTTDAVPFDWQIPGWNWALIIPLSLVVGCHLLLPVRFWDLAG